MQWNDQGIVLSIRPFGEGKAIVTLLTENHGKASGLCRGTSKPSTRGLLQTGNLLCADWRGRLAEHLGAFTLELRKPYAAQIFHLPTALELLCSACELCQNSLAEHDPHPLLFKQLCALLEALNSKKNPLFSYLNFELQLLEAAGFALDLSHCAATGQTESLFYISPKTGRAVSKEAGKPYHDRLFRLPEILRAGNHNSSIEDCKLALEITGFFLQNHILSTQQKQLPNSRSRALSFFFEENLKAALAH
jgi:DNA repair protein RecO (recombination protein O)